MAGVVHSIDELVGHTPLMELDRLNGSSTVGRISSQSWNFLTRPAALRIARRWR